MTIAKETAAGSTDVRLDRAFELVADARVKALTLDVFDTLLFRRVPEPVDAFPIVGARLAEHGMLADHIAPLAFGRLRVLAEERARWVLQAGGAGVEVSLAQIYEQIPRGLFHDSDLGDVTQVEVDVERSLLGPDLDVLELVQAARAAGARVIGVSDTYFSAEQLRWFMHPWYTQELPLDGLYASSDHGQGKTEGLFEIVLREQGLEPTEVVHVGDNELADVEGARRHGIRSFLFERRPRELDRVLEREAEYTHAELPAGDGGSTALRGKVLQRRELREMPEELRTFWSYGAVSLGPAFAGFAEWVQRRAEAAGVSRAFCLMREGELLTQLVSTAGDYMNTGIDAAPAWLSRQVCARAAIFDGHPDEFAALLTRRRPPTVAEYCATLGVRPEASPLLSGRLDSRLNDPALANDVIEEMAANPELRGPVLARARTMRERVIGYVESLLPAGERNMVLVDLGWGGSIQKMLQDVLHRSGSDVHTVGLYLVTDDRATQRLVEGIDIAGFLASQGVPRVAERAIMRSPEILEQVCMPDVGSQVDLDSDLQPVLSASVDSDRVQSAERAAVQKGIRAFQREWARYQPLEPVRSRLAEPQVRRTLLAQVARATVAPTATEAAAFGRWVHDENFGSSGVEPITGDAHHHRALRWLDPGTLTRIPMREIYWPFGLAAVEDERLAQGVEAVSMGLLPEEAFYSGLEVGDVAFYFDNGFGYSADWMQTAEGRRNRYGLSYARSLLYADEVRGVRIDPVRSACLLRVDWVAFTCFVRGEAQPRRLVFDTHEALESAFTLRGLGVAGAKLFNADAGSQLEIDLRAALGGAMPYEVLAELAYAVMLIDPRGADHEHARELQRRTADRSRAAKRLVRQVESRTGVPIGGPLRRAYRKLRRR